MVVRAVCRYQGRRDVITRRVVMVSRVPIADRGEEVRGSRDFDVRGDRV